MRHNDRTREKRKIDFQNNILKVLEGRKKNKFLVIINSPIMIFLFSFTAITLGGGYYTTYQRCVAEARAVVDTFSSYNFEINYRTSQMMEGIVEANTVDEVNKIALGNYYFKKSLSDKSLAELRADERAAYLRIDKSRIDLSSVRALTSNPLYARFSLVLVGSVPSGFSISDLPDLKKFASLVLSANLLQIMHSVGTVYEYRCTPGVIGNIALGNTPVVARAVEVGFLEREKRDLRQK